MSAKLKITKLELKTASGEKISLTIKEAKELFNQLEELFGIKNTLLPTTPIIIERNNYFKKCPFPLSPPIIWGTSDVSQFVRSGENIGITYTYENIS